MNDLIASQENILQIDQIFGGVSTDEVYPIRIQSDSRQHDQVFKAPSADNRQVAVVRRVTDEVRKYFEYFHWKIADAFVRVKDYLFYIYRAIRTNFELF